MLHMDSSAVTQPVKYLLQLNTKEASQTNSASLISAGETIIQSEIAADMWYLLAL